MRRCICIRICTRACTHTHTYIYMRMSVYVCMYVRMHGCMHAYVCACTYVCMSACLSVCLPVCLSVCLSIRPSLCVCRFSLHCPTQTWEAMGTLQKSRRPGIVHSSDRASLVRVSGFTVWRLLGFRVAKCRLATTRTGQERNPLWLPVGGWCPAWLTGWSNMPSKMPCSRRL